MGERTAHVQPGDLGATMARLASVIHDRRTADPEASYTKRLLIYPE